MRIGTKLNAKTGRIKINKVNPINDGIFDDTFDSTFE
jgi:hypothetical protein